MPPQYTLPPDTRSIGSGNPPADMNAVVDAVTAMGAGLNVLNAAFAGGADPAGVNDSAAALQAAVNALPASGGTIWIPPGAYKATSTVTITGKYVTIRGSGRWATAWNYTGSGDAFRVFNTDTTGLITGGGLYDFTIDGSGAGAGACGLHMGDMRATELRIAVQNFSGTGSVNVLFDNQYCWMEECHGYLWLINGTRNLVFSVSEPAGGSYTATNASPAVFTCASPTFANGIQVVLSGGTPPTGFTNGTGYFVVNASGNTFQLSATSGGAAINSTSTGNGTVTQATSTNSFGYSDFQVEMLSRVGQDGLVIQNGAFLYNSKLAMRANFQGSASPQSNAVVRITGTTPVGHLNGGGPAKITSCHLDVQAELNPTGGGSNAPQTIVWGNLSGNLLLGCYGILDFAQGSIGFATSNWTPAGGVGAFTFTGVIRGDANLGGGGNFYSPTVVGPVIYGKSLLNNTNGNTQVNYGDFFSLTLTQSITVNLNPSAASTQAGAQRKTIVLKQAASGGPFTVTWPNTGSPSISNCTVVWPGGITPVMSPTPGAVDVYVLETYDGATWYGNALQQDNGPDYLYSQNLASGETVIPRLNVGTGAALVSQTMALSYWTAVKTETVNNIIGNTASTAAGATPTYCAMGVYSVAANGNLTLLGQCASDTTLFASTFTAYTRAVTTPFTKIDGQRYAFGFLVVSAAAMPNLVGYNGSTVLAATAPRITGIVTGQSTLPSTVTAGSVSSTPNMYFGAVTP